MSAPIDIDIALASVLPANKEPFKLPDNAKGISSLLGKGGAYYTNLLGAVVRLRSGRELKPGMLEDVAMWLQALHGLELLDPRYK